jgi:hypothetical protein
MRWTPSTTTRRDKNYLRVCLDFELADPMGCKKKHHSCMSIIISLTKIGKLYHLSKTILKLLG